MKNIITQSIKIKELIISGNYEEAIEEAKKILDTPNINEESKTIIRSQYITALIKSGKNEEAIEETKIALNNPNIKPKYRQILTTQLMTALSGIERYEEAIKESKNLLGDDINSESKIVLQNQIITLITKAIKSGKQEEIIDITKELHDNPNIDEEHKQLLESQLLKALIKSEQFDEAIKESKDALRNPNIYENNRHIITSQLVTALTREGRYEEAIEELTSLFKIKSSTGKQDEIIIKQFTTIMLKMEANGEYEKVTDTIKMLQKDSSIDKDIINKLDKALKEIRLLNANKDNLMQELIDSRYERFDNGNFLTTEDLDLIENSYIANYHYDGEISAYTRSNLYNGNIQIEDLKDLTEENSKTLPGCIFIAETCKYFALEQLGLKCLQGFKKNNPNLKPEEEKAISKAIELLKSKKEIVRRGEDWNNIYEDLHRTNKLEEDDYIL